MKHDVNCGLDRHHIVCSAAAVTQLSTTEVLSVVSADDQQARDLRMAGQDLTDAQHNNTASDYICKRSQLVSNSRSACRFGLLPGPHAIGAIMQEGRCQIQHRFKVKQFVNL